MENENTAAEETTQLQQTVTDVTIVPPESGNPVGAASSSSDESGDAQGKIIEQQQSTIDALLARTEQLTKQLNMLIAQGVQITDETPKAMQEPNDDMLSDDYVSLSDLGAEIGKHDRY